MKMKMLAAALAGAAFATFATAKLPPISDEAKAKAAEAKAKSDHGAAVEAFKLCRSMERVADRYARDLKTKGKEIKPTETAACKDPGPFQAAAAPAK